MKNRKMCPKNTNSKCQIITLKVKVRRVKGWAWIDENGLFCAYKLLPNKKTTPFHDIISSREDGYIPVTITYRLPRKGEK